MVIAAERTSDQRSDQDRVDEEVINTNAIVFDQSKPSRCLTRPT